MSALRITVTNSAGMSRGQPPNTGCEAGDAEARVAYVLRTHVLHRIGARLTDEGLDALLVKGAALALTVYDRPWSRSMQDVDLLVRPGSGARVLRALEELGFTRQGLPGRPLSADTLGEVALRADYGQASLRIEVHTRLDKLVGRPIDHDEIFARASEAPGLPGLLVPAAEDHVLLIVLHAATAGFVHRVAFDDLALLFERGLDQAVLLERARRWRLRTAAFLALEALRHVMPGVPESLVRALRPGPLRRAILGRLYHPAQFPFTDTAPRLGMPWILGQTPIRDDLGRWCVGVLRYAVLRTIERGGLMMRPGQGS